MKDRLFDWALGAAGLTLFILSVLLLAIATTGKGHDYSTKAGCEAAGGQWVQTMKTYHACKLPK